MMRPTSGIKTVAEVSLAELRQANYYARFALKAGVYHNRSLKTFFFPTSNID